MTLKTMDVPLYLGNHLNDSLYWAHSGFTYDALQPLISNEAAWIAMYFMGQSRRATNVKVPAQLGTSSINSVNGRGKENPCYHVKSLGLNVPHLYYIGHYLGTSGRYLGEYYRRPALSKSVVLNPPAFDYRAAKSRAFHSMRPRFEGDISMLNFLFELKDFRDIARFLPKAYKGIGKAWNDTLNHARRNKTFWYGALRSDFNYQTLISTKYYSDVVKRNRTYVNELLTGVKTFKPTLVAAEIQLLNSFMLQPLMKDISKILSQATIAAYDAQSKFKTLGLTEQKSHFTEKTFYETSGVTGTDNYYWLRTGIARSHTYTATCSYTYDYTMRSHFDAFMRYWGLSGSFEALWNAIPFSFLLDYIVQIGKSIHAMERDSNVDWHVKTWVDTIKYVYSSGQYIIEDPRSKVFVVDGKYLSPAKAHGKLLSGAEGSIYDRRVSQPTAGLFVPKLRGPSLQQWLNVVALARCFF